MDPIIQGYKYVANNNFNYCYDNGVAYRQNMSKPITIKKEVNGKLDLERQEALRKYAGPDIKRINITADYKPQKKVDDRPAMCWTFWDSLVCFPNPQKILVEIPLYAYVFVSLPVVNDLDDIRDTKHYYYFTPTGFIRWLGYYNFKLVKTMDFEERVGRQNIKTFMLEKTDKVNRLNNSFIQEYFKTKEKETNELIKELNDDST